MEDKDKNEELIEKLIEKRKQENDAFIKLLSAIESKGSAAEAKDKSIHKYKATGKSAGKKQNGE